MKPMTEAEWFACGDPGQMLMRYPGTLTDRKARLYACACCREVWHLLEHEPSRTAVEICERYADGFLGPDDLRLAWEAALEITWLYDAPIAEAGSGTRENSKAHAAAAAAYTVLPNRNTTPNHFDGPRGAAEYVACAMATGETGIEWSADRDLKRTRSIAVLRDIVGNPFRHVTWIPTWLTPDVLAVAQGIYDGRAFDRMPILSDALIEAGCDDAAILAHCRDEGRHWLGCWVVDLVLGRT